MRNAPVLASMLFAMISGCGAPIDAQSQSGSLNYETRVELRPEGNRVLSVRQSPLVEEQAGVAREAISKDTTCASGDTILYTGTGGSGAHICFTGIGVANLGDYVIFCNPPPRAYCTYWNGMVKSYLGGNHAGYLQVSGGGCTEDWFANQSLTNAGTCGQSADQVGRS